MYRLYRFFAAHGQGTNFIHALSALPHGVLKQLGLAFAPVNRR